MRHRQFAQPALTTAGVENEKFSRRCRGTWHTITIRCSGRLHRLQWQERGPIRMLNHRGADLEAVRTLQKLGDTTCKCLKVYDCLIRDLKGGAYGSTHKDWRRPHVLAYEAHKARGLNRPDPEPKRSRDDMLARHHLHVRSVLNERITELAKRLFDVRASDSFTIDIHLFPGRPPFGSFMAWAMLQCTAPWVPPNTKSQTFTSVHFELEVFLHSRAAKAEGLGLAEFDGGVVIDVEDLNSTRDRARITYVKLIVPPQSPGFEMFGRFNGGLAHHRVNVMRAAAGGGWTALPTTN